jgi:hypothetical protein
MSNHSVGIQRGWRDGKPCQASPLWRRATNQRRTMYQGRLRPVLARRVHLQPKILHVPWLPPLYDLQPSSYHRWSVIIRISLTIFRHRDNPPPGLYPRCEQSKLGIGGPTRADERYTSLGCLLASDTNRSRIVWAL